MVVPLYIKVISCVSSVLAIPTSCFIVKILFEKNTKLQSLSKCVCRCFKEHVLTLVVNQPLKVFRVKVVQVCVGNNKVKVKKLN